MARSARPRIGLIGAGRWGKVYLKTLAALSDRCCLTHVATSQPSHGAVTRLPVAILREWRQLLRADCDAIIIATPPQMHAEMLEACLEVGKPCLVEKPLCLDVATAERLHRIVGASGVPVLVDHTQLFHPAYQALKQTLQQAGEPVQVMMSEGMALGPFREDVPALWDWGPHDVSLCIDLIGQPPAQVSALGGPRDLQGAPEMVSLRLDFPGGACAWVQTGRLSTEKRRRLSVVTERHIYVCDDSAPHRLLVAPIEFSQRVTGGMPDSLEWQPLPSDTALSPMAAMLTAFLDGIESDKCDRFGTGLAVEVVRVLAAAEAELGHTAYTRSVARA